jgi:hypothetical protein
VWPDPSDQPPAAAAAPASRLDGELLLHAQGEVGRRLFAGGLEGLHGDGPLGQEAHHDVLTRLDVGDGVEALLLRWTGIDEAGRRDVANASSSGSSRSWSKVSVTPSFLRKMAISWSSLPSLAISKDTMPASIVRGTSSKA